MKRISVAALIAFALVGCGSSDDPPGVDWSRVPQNQHVLIGDAVDARDCAALQTYFDGSERSDVLEYLDWHMEHAGCY